MKYFTYFLRDYHAYAFTSGSAVFSFVLRDYSKPIITCLLLTAKLELN